MASGIELDCVGSDASAPLEHNTELGYTDSQIQKVASYAFATLAGLASAGIAVVSFCGMFNISAMCAIPFALIAGSLIQIGARIPDSSTYAICAAAKGIHTEFLHARFEDMYKKYGLDVLLQTFSTAELKQKFDRETQDPKTTFWSVIKAYDLQALLDRGIIDHGHFALLQDLKQRAEVHKDISFPHEKRQVLTLYANQPIAFKEVMALDAEYKGKLASTPAPYLPTVNLSMGSIPPSVTPSKRPSYFDARIKRIACYAFAALAGMATVGIAAVAYWGVFKISMGIAAYPLAATVASLHLVTKVIDYKDPEVQKKLRAQLADSPFVKMYREHGLSNLLHVLSPSELKQKFDAEVRDAKTTFWNVLRRYDIQELHGSGIITSEHLAVLQSMRRSCMPIHLDVSPGRERWKQTNLFDRYSKSHHVLTAFANAPEAFRMAEALDRAYKDVQQVQQ